MAVRLTSIIRKQLDVEISIRDVFTHATIDDLEAHLTTLDKGTLLPRVVAVEQKPDNIPLSFSQESLWFLDQLQGSLEYHLPIALRLSGNLDKQALTKSLKEVVQRHEALRTVIYSKDGVGYQKLLPADKWELSTELVSNEGPLPSQRITSFLTEPFDLTLDYMFRARLYEIGEKEYVLAGAFHHIASDAWSQAILMREFIQLYHAHVSGRTSKLPKLELQYMDYALWQREHLEDNIIEEQLAYWENQLREVPTLKLPTDQPRPTLQSIEGANLSFELDSELSSHIKSLGRDQGATVFMTLLAAFKVLLARYSGQQDICVGTSVANRTQKEMEDMIGFFVNTLALRTEITENGSFEELLQNVKQTTLDAYDHQEVPFEKVVDRVVPTRENGMNPVFQVLFVLQNARDAEMDAKTQKYQIEGLELSRYEGQAGVTANFDMKMTVNETSTGFYMTLNYRTDLFREETIQRMAAHYQNLLNGIVEVPSAPLSEIPMLSKTEEEHLLKAFSGKRIDYPRNTTVVDLFEEQANKTPQAVALVCEQETLTYQELDQRANQLARYLISKGIRSGALVGICTERSIEMMVGIIAILKAGGAYVPIDPEYPKARIGHMLKDSKVSILISDKKNA